MEKVLGRKQNIRNEDWINAMQHIEDLVKKEELDELVDQTVSEILEQTEGKKVAFAWSGGKDSLVLEKVCEMAGIHECIMAVCNLEYPAFMEWVESHKPEKLEIINTGQNMDWLLKHQNMLFPQKSNVAAQWFHMVQHRGQARQWTGSVENGWKEVFEIDNRIVIDAAKTIPSAREFLEKNGK